MFGLIKKKGEKDTCDMMFGLKERWEMIVHH